MNFKRTMFYLSNICFLATNAITDVDRLVGFSCSQFGPFDLKSETETISLTYTTNKNYYNVSEVMSLAYHGYPTSYVSRKPPTGIEVGEIGFVDFDVPLKDYFSSYGLDFSFSLYSYTTNENIFSTEATIYPIGIEIINPFDNEDGIYESLPVAFSISCGRTKEITCKYDFSNISEYFEDESYLYLDISKYSFDYYSIDQFSYSTAQMKFLDKNGLFPYLSSKSDGYKHIPLSLNCQNNKVSFSFKRNYYVDENTMQISDMLREGFVRTEFFYLPNNSREDIEDYEFIFQFFDVGLHKAQILFTMGYLSSKNLFGSCNDSQYCIEGGVVS